jgi:cysteinyl-tRNA synthetase
MKKFSPEVIRYMFISTHYRKKMDYTESLANNAKTNYLKLKETFENLNHALKSASEEKTSLDDEFLKKMKEIREKFTEAMDDDFNTPIALSVFHELSKEINKYLEENKNKQVLGSALNLFKEFSDVFGLKFEIEEKKLSEEVEKLIAEREEARNKGDFKKSDEIRKRLKEEFQIVLEDTKKGIKWKKIR